MNWKDEFQEHIALEAQTVLNKDLSFRTWATMHGGVYVPPTEKTPPNPYLAFLPDRDIVNQRQEPDAYESCIHDWSGYERV